MNTDWSDKILDSFLEEAVTGRRPPNLLASITTAWQQERAGQIPLTSRAETTGGLIAPPIVAVATAMHKPAVVLPEKRLVSHRWQVLLVLAASGILIACAVQWRATFVSPMGSIAAGSKDYTAPKVYTVPPSQLPRVAKSNDSLLPKKDKEGFESEKLGIEDVPFAAREPHRTDPTTKTNSSTLANRLSDQQIVELIDTQLTELWQRLKVTPESKLDEVRLAQSLAMTLTGQELPSTTAADLAELKSGERREQAIAKVITQAIDSQAFSRLWAKELVADWLRGGRLALDSAPVEQLEQFVASGIAADQPWNEVVAKVISGESTTGDVLVTAFAGGGNHRLVSRLSRAFMDSSLGCVRCHEAKGTSSVVTAQQQYWSLVAMLVGLDIRSIEKSTERTAVDNQAEVFAESKQPSLFFDRPDGTLEAAKFVLPDGRPWQYVGGARTPRAALANWIANSDQADQAIVNQVWQVALGRPLVAPHAMIDDAGLAERRELQQLLAQQFRAHGRNLSQLVSWVVRSDAFARDAISVDQNRWLQAAEIDIENWHLAEVTFAARTSLGEQAVKGGLENSLVAAIKWNQSNSEGGASVLAQPSLDPKVKPKTPIKSDVIMPSRGYVIHRGRLSKDQQAYIAGLAASEKLTWEQKVEHVVALSPVLSVSGGVKRLSDELLKSLGDPKAVLTELMWAVQNADAS